jgi:hypothetical protein
MDTACTCHHSILEKVGNMPNQNVGKHLILGLRRRWLMYAGWWLILLKSGGGWKLEKLENAVWLKIKV